MNKKKIKFIENLSCGGLTLIARASSKESSPSEALLSHGDSKHLGTKKNNLLLQGERTLRESELLEPKGMEEIKPFFKLIHKRDRDRGEAT
jgi:hypothetical protein